MQLNRHCQHLLPHTSISAHAEGQHLTTPQTAHQIDENYKTPIPDLCREPIASSPAQQGAQPRDRGRHRRRKGDGAGRVGGGRPKVERDLRARRCRGEADRPLNALCNVLERCGRQCVVLRGRQLGRHLISQAGSLRAAQKLKNVPSCTLCFQVLASALC